MDQTHGNDKNVQKFISPCVCTVQKKFWNKKLMQFWYVNLYRSILICITEVEVDAVILCQLYTNSQDSTAFHCLTCIFHLLRHSIPNFVSLTIRFQDLQFLKSCKNIPFLCIYPLHIQRYASYHSSWFLKMTFSVKKLHLTTPTFELLEKTQAFFFSSLASSTTPKKK